MKLFKNSGKLWCLLACLAVGGCIDRSYNMIGKECPQVVKHEPPYSLIKQYLHSITLYEGYETKAHFDALIMSDQMSAVYAALRSAKAGDNENERLALLSQQLEENRQYRTMYILADVADQSHISLSDKNSAWSLFVTTPSGKKIAPLSLKEVDLSPEIRSIFGYRYVPFKKSYLVKFAANDIQGHPYLRPGDVATLTFAGAGMAGNVQWQERQLQKTEATPEQLLKRQNSSDLRSLFSGIAAPQERDEDFYW